MGEGEKSEPWRRVSSVKPKMQHKNTIEVETIKPTSKTRKKTMYTQHGHESMFGHFSFFLPQSNVECYTLESDISIGSGSFAASGHCVW